MSTSVAVKERPILFSGAMVRALLAGTKTQTRRICKPQPVADATHAGTYISHPPKPHDGRWEWMSGDPKDMESWEMLDCEPSRCPYGAPGDLLWCRESCMISDNKDAVMYRDHGGKLAPTAKPGSEVWARTWKSCPSIHMPRWASRILLEITDVRVQRLQEISHRDAVAEGWPGYCKSWETGKPIPLGSEQACADVGDHPVQERDAIEVTGDGDDACIEWYADLWESINGAGSWDANPWVWALTFKRVQP